MLMNLSAVPSQDEGRMRAELSHALGGYSQRIVVHERYVPRICQFEAQLAAVVPLV